MLVETKAKVAVFSIALGAYLPQFPELVPEFEQQYADFVSSLPDTVEVVDGGMCTTKEAAAAAGDKFRAADVDLVFCQLLTYATSYNMLPAIRDLNVPVVLVNLQKVRCLDFETAGTAEWLGVAYAGGAVGEMVADLNRDTPSSPASWRAATPRLPLRSRAGAVLTRCAVACATPTSRRSAAPTPA